MGGRKQKAGRDRGTTRITRSTTRSARASGAGGCDPPASSPQDPVDPAELAKVDLSDIPRSLNTNTKASKPIQSRSKEQGIHVIVLGPSGGPLEDTVTGFLVRSTALDWRENSMLAVDAGTLLSGIYRALCGKATLEESPFAGLQVPDSPGGFNPKQIAAYIFQRMIASVCITHPHLDHVSGFGINAALLKADSERKKVVAGLEGVITALKTHVFNGIIWPNFTDEDGGLGLFRFKRLEEGSLVPPSQDDGDYAILSRGLSVKAFRLNHGSCSNSSGPDPETYSSSADPFEFEGQRIESTAFFVRDVLTRKEVIIFGDVEPDSLVFEQRNQQVWQAAAPKFVDGHLRAIFIECSYDDSVANDALYGHLCPRHLVDELGVFAQLVKRERVDRSFYLASPESAKSKNKRSRDDDYTGLGRTAQKKAIIPSWEEDTRMTTPTEDGAIAEPKGDEDTMMTEPMTAPMTGEPMMGEPLAQPLAEPSIEEQLAAAGEQAGASANEILEQTMSELVPSPLEGLRVYLIHIKDDMQGPNPGDRILAEVRGHVQEAALGCVVDVVKAGQSIYF